MMITDDNSDKKTARKEREREREREREQVNRAGINQHYYLFFTLPC